LTAALLPGYAGSMSAMMIRTALAALFASALSLACAAPTLAETPPPEPPGKAEPPAKSAGKRAAPKGMPKTPQQREKALSDLYALLATAESADTAKAIADGIERIWVHSGSPTIDLLMFRANKAITEKNYDLAIKLLDHAVELAPDFTEGWNRRAYVHFQRNSIQLALGDLRRALALDPNHYRALEGLGQILREIGEKKAALRAFRQLIDVHPHWSGAQQTIDELAREVEGQGI
jgi:tetratricopeptide (TPR) repeat protein